MKKVENYTVVRIGNEKENDDVVRMKNEHMGTSAIAKIENE